MPIGMDSKKVQPDAKSMSKHIEGRKHSDQTGTRNMGMKKWRASQGNPDSGGNGTTIRPLEKTEETQMSINQGVPNEGKSIHRGMERAFSLDEKHWQRRFKTSQESLTKQNGSSSESLQEGRASRDFKPHLSNRLIESCFNAQSGFSSVSSIGNGHCAGRNDTTRDMASNRPLRDDIKSWSKPQLIDSKRMQAFPQMESNVTWRALRTANRIDPDYMDYSRSQHRLLRHNSSLSDTGLNSTMVCHHCSTDSMKSTSSALTPIRSKDVRNRSYMEGSLLASGALLGAEELDRYFPERRMKIFIATWNMQGKKEFPESLDELLLPAGIDFTQDIYVVGIQEGGLDRREWEIRLQETLGPHYVMLQSAAHGVLYLSLLIRRDLIWFCSGVENATVTTRIVSQIKTKGALAMSFTFFGTSFLFITSHFTSGDGKVHDRILDYKKIIEGLPLPRITPDTNPYRSNSSDVTSRFDEVFWFGDFNFRLNKDRKGLDSILQRKPEKNMTQLLQHDQLIKERNDGSVFRGFEEGEIQFLPTYKFHVESDVYDTSSKQRTPSYTDRVMYKSRQAGDITVLKYSSCPSMRMSDHRPVFGVFDVRIRPGRDNIPLAAGQFDRDIYMEGLKRRRSRELKARQAVKTHKSSAVCSIS